MPYGLKFIPPPLAVVVDFEPFAFDFSDNEELKEATKNIFGTIGKN